MAAALALLRFGFAAADDGGAAAVGGRFAPDHAGYLALALAPAVRPFAGAREVVELCADDQAASGTGVRRVRCAVPPGGLPPLTGPILTPATPAPQPPAAPANANEPVKEAS